MRVINDAMSHRGNCLFFPTFCINAVLSYYEADSVYLSILACILVALDSEAEYPMDASHVCRVLASASRFVDDEQPTLKPPNPKTQRPSRFLAGGALSWLPLHEWRPSSVRLLNHFHHVCDAVRCKRKVLWHE